MNEQEKKCDYCQELIEGEAIPLQEETSTDFGRNVYERRTLYLHPDCAREMAEECSQTNG